MPSPMRSGTIARLALSAIFLCSCINPRYPSKGKPVVFRDNASLVFGRIQVVEDDVDVTGEFCDPTDLLSSTERLLGFTLLDLETRKVAQNVAVENDGAFYWILPAGAYRLMNMNYRTDVDPYLAFRIRDGSKYVYIGNIVLRSASRIVPHLSVPKRKAGIGREYDVVGISVEDDYEREVEGVKARFPGPGKEFVKSLMFPNHDR